ncbi:carboxymuconolactone decarboxylase family protein [Curtobacterium sp. VKM Ac-2865]|uniref:carboxymuconolactone decarboxylase family protein n=1 Tax=Curtobacterium sp. VKM Ac-2865 TaxID=2783817 RepID=UPI00188A66E8|nr:carboxymuconolactone decarboxylase family protein [Curtobacterium sp. VKM Ac-2865]MBF4581660.1 carboxymuconolactone decarboxylase family protein [Curtobacterium sp. VKM Ac-2865]
MTIHDDAQQELATLFPDATTSLAETDPEFWAYHADFALGEVLAESALSRADRLTYQLAATIAVGAHAPFRSLLRAALEHGVTPVQVKEVAYQAVAYVGVARVVDFIAITNEVLTERGVALPLPGQSTTTPADRMDLGIAVQRQIVGTETVDAMYDDAPADALRFQRFLSANCFGDHYTRTGFDLQHRELITFALLVALGGADTQVKGHVAANRNVGTTRAQLLDVLTVLLPLVGYPRTLNGLAQVNAAAPAGDD